MTNLVAEITWITSNTKKCLGLDLCTKNTTSTWNKGTVTLFILNGKLFIVLILLHYPFLNTCYIKACLAKRRSTRRVHCQYIWKSLILNLGSKILNNLICYSAPNSFKVMVNKGLARNSYNYLSYLITFAHASQMYRGKRLSSKKVKIREIIHI